jgi:hypothetical protein
VRFTGRGEPAHQPHPAHDGRHPNPQPRHCRAPLLRAQSARRARHPRKPCAASTDASATSSTTSSSWTGRAESDRADHLRPRGRHRLHPLHQPAARAGAAPPSRPAPRPGIQGFIALAWKDDRLVGIEILVAGALADQGAPIPGQIAQLADRLGAGSKPHPAATPLANAAHRPQGKSSPTDNGAFFLVTGVPSSPAHTGTCPPQRLRTGVPHLMPPPLLYFAAVLAAQAFELSF